MSIDKEKIQKTLKTNMDLLEKKNQDYSNMNLVVEGPRGIVTRLVDKVARLRNLLSETGVEPNFESIKDTFGDVANYGIIGQLMQEGGILNDTQKVFILNDEVDNPSCTGVQSVFPEILVMQCKELEDGLRKNGLSFVSSMATLRGVTCEAGLDLKKQMIGWADAVVVMHGLSIRTARLVEFATQRGKQVLLVGIEDQGEETAKCICCNDSEKAVSILVSGGLNG